MDERPAPSVQRGEEADVARCPQRDRTACPGRIARDRSADAPAWRFRGRRVKASSVPRGERPARRSGRQTQRTPDGPPHVKSSRCSRRDSQTVRSCGKLPAPASGTPVLFPLPRAPPRRKHGRRRIRVDQHVQPSSAAHTARCAARSPSYGTRNAVRSKPSTRSRTWCAKWPPATTPARRAAMPARRAATAAIVPVVAARNSSTSSPSGVGLAYDCRISSTAQTLGGSARPTRIARRQPVVLEPPDLPRPAPFAALEHRSPRFRRPPIQPQPLAPSPAFTACDVRLPAAPAGW